MNDVYEIRRQNLKRLLAERGAKTALAIRLDMTQAQISHWLRNPRVPTSRKIHEDGAREIENVLGLLPHQLDQERGAAAVTPLTEQMLRDTTRAVIAAAQVAEVGMDLSRLSDLVFLACEHNRLIGRMDEAYIQGLVKLANVGVTKSTENF